MKKPSAMAVLEFADIPTGVWAVDTILKKAPIAFVRAGTVTRGRYLVVFGGSTAATAESLAEALATSGGAVIDHTFLPDAHPVLFDAAFGARRKSTGSLLIIETETASSIVRAAEHRPPFRWPPGWPHIRHRGASRPSARFPSPPAPRQRGAVRSAQPAFL